MKMGRTTLIVGAVAGVLVIVAGVVVYGLLTRPTAEERAAQKLEQSLESQRRSDEIADSLVSDIRYLVDGTTSQASITVATPTGTKQQSNIDVPLTSKNGQGFLQFSFSPGAFVYISAQNSKGFGSVTCAIWDEDGNVLAENEATGGYAIATCQAKAP